MKQKIEIINCPYCNREYLPSEIFIPNAFFGRPYYIERDVEGKIIDIKGSTQDLIETFTCENCNKEFKIETKLSFKSIPNDFEEEYERRTTLGLKLKEN